MKTCHLSVEPPKLACLLPNEEQKKSIMLVDVAVDYQLEENKGRSFNKYIVDLDVSFDALSFKVLGVQKRNCYIGSTGGEIEFNASTGKLKNYTTGKKFKVKYSEEVKRIRSTDLTIHPKLKQETGGQKIELELGSINFTAGSERVFKTALENEESTLAHVIKDKLIKWTVNLPNMQSPIRNFLFGNLYLSFELLDDSPEISGRLRIKPLDIRFFDADKNRVDERKALYLLLITTCRGVIPKNKDGFEISYRIKLIDTHE